MIGVIVKAAAVAAGVGFGAGILAHRKGSKVKEEVKERLSNTQTEIVRVKIPKGQNLDDVVVRTKVLIPEYEDELGLGD